MDADNLTLGAPAGSGIAELLQDAANLQLYRSNAFRVLELPTDAAPRPANWLGAVNS